MARGRCVYIEPSDEVLRVVAARMRAADQIEAVALGHVDPLAALVASRDASSICHAVASMDDEAAVLGVGGLVTHEDFHGVAVPWAILTDAGARRKRWIVREARRWIAEWSERYTLRNGVHASNRKGIDFVEVLGFEVAEEPFRIEETGAEFLIFALPKVRVVEVPLCASG